MRDLQTKGLEQVYIYTEWDWGDAMWHAHCAVLKVFEFLHAAFNLVREHRSTFVFASTRLVLEMNKLWTIST